MRTFKKNMSYFNSEQIKQLFEKQRFIYDKSKKQSLFKTPQPISYGEDFIEYEYLDLRNKLSLFVLDGAPLKKNILQKLAKAIASFLQISTHGDLVLKNIALTAEGDIIIFDIEPPPEKEKFKKYFNSEPEQDLAQLFISFLSSVSYKKPLKFIKLGLLNASRFWSFFQKEYNFKKGKFLKYLIFEYLRFVRETFKLNKNKFLAIYKIIIFSFKIY